MASQGKAGTGPTTHSIHVDAPPADVLAVIADVAEYPAWADGIRHAEVLEVDATGRPARAEFRLESGPFRDEYELAYTWSDAEVRWTLVRASLLTAMDGAYTVHPDADGGSAVSYRLTVDLNVPLLGMIKRKAERTVIDTALRDLKKRVEG